MIRARMEIEEILADDQDARARLAPVIFDRIHPLDRLLKPRRAPGKPMLLPTIHDEIHRLSNA